METKKISYEVKDSVAYVGFGVSEKKSMVTLDKDTLLELRKIVEQVKEDKTLKGLIFFSHKENCFLAGADINLISSLKTETEAAQGAESGQVLFNMIEDLKIPSIACVNGVCLGGGFELALSCRHILVSDSSKTVLGLPEVKLGILPGFGGTFRLPQRVPMHKALDLILSGKHVKAKKAYKMGLADGIFPKEKLLSMTKDYFRKPKFFQKKSSFKSSLETIAQDNFLTRKVVFQKARESVLKLTKGHYQAPLKILEVMEEGQGRDRDSYLALESQAFGQLCISEQSQNLRHVFFLMEGAKKYTGPKVQEDQVVKVKRSAVLGAGVMGGGIAWLMANSNQFPVMKDISVDALELGLKQSGDNFSKAVKRKKMTQEEFERKQRSIHPSTSFEGFKRVDLVVEAIIEDINIKKKVFGELEGEVRDDCVIASNTSALSLTEMAKTFKKPERFAGLHFFNPVHRMPLVEIVAHSQVSPETLKSLYNWVISVKKTPVIVKDGPGFLVNRMLCPFLNEAAYLLEEGVPLQSIEEASVNFGMPMGPCRLMDEVGLDTLVKVGEILYKGLGERAKPCLLSEKIVGINLLGKKGGKGFYHYDEKGKETEVNDEINSVLPTKEVKMDELKIQMRLFMPMINEACYLLDEKIVENPSDIDLGMIFGTGFPPFRGGPMKYADSKGAEFILETLKGLQKEVSEDRYCPSPYLEKMVQEKRKFYDVS